MVTVNPITSGNVYNSSINKNDRVADKAIGQLSSGKSINKASDNAAGLAIATQLLSDVSSLRQSSTNLLQGTSLLQTADAGLQQADGILNRLKELSTQASSGALDANSRTAINDEYQALKTELNELGSSTTFNGQSLLNGTYNNDFQAGTEATKVVNVDLTAVDVSSSGLGLTAAAGDNASALLTPANAQATSAEIDTAINRISNNRAEIGALQSSLQARGDVVESETENTISAQSAIIDADIGRAISDFVASKNLTDLNIAAAAQGNKSASSLLKLVR